MSRKKPRSSQITASGLIVIQLYVEQEVDHVAVLHHILLALGTNQSLGPGSSQGAARLEIVVGNDLGANEAALKVGVNLTGSLGCLGALLNGPGTALVGSGGQEGDQPQQRIGDWFVPRARSM